MQINITFLYFIVGFLFNYLIFIGICKAQVIEDKTVNTQVMLTQLEGNIRGYKIYGGEQKKGNLFHSFTQFSPGTRTVIFENAADVKNIFSRVTGGTVSHINGLIQAQHNANLFLLNPNGIILGSQAQLQIGGSFIATTANQINFANGYSFSASDHQVQPLLTSSLPIGLQFRDKAEPIVNRSRVLAKGDEPMDPSGLRVQMGKTIALIGGDVRLEQGNLFAPGGRIEIGSVAENSFVGLSPINEAWSLNYATVENFLDIKLKGAVIRASNLESNDATLDKLGGTISLRGHDISIADGSQVVNLNISGVQLGGEIGIKATDRVVLSGGSSINSNTFSLGSSGNILVESSRLVVNNSFIDASNQGLGEGIGGERGGNLTIKTNESVDISDNGRLTTTTFTRGNAGDLNVTTARLVVSDGGQINSESKGKFSLGNGGNIGIKTRRLVVKEGGSISVAAQNDSSGRAGSMSIEATQSLTLTGRGSKLLATSASSQPAGNLTIRTPQLTLQKGALISATSVNGQGGSITLQGLDNLQITHSSIEASTQSGIAGSLTIQSAQSVALQEKGRLLVEATSGGTAGNLSVETGQMSLAPGATVSVSSSQGQGGTLKISANSLNLNRGSITAETGKTGTASGANITLGISNVLKLGNNSQISATANGEANGGNIDIDALFLAAFPSRNSNGNDIIAKAVLGNGGNININAQGIFGIAERQALAGDQSNDIDASSEFGSSGQVQINSTIDPNRGVIQLPENIIDSAELIDQNPCRKGNKSQFTHTGRGGLPPSPKDDLSAIATQVGLVEPALNDAQGQDRGQSIEPEGEHPAVAIAKSAQSAQSIVPAQGWIFNTKGEVILVAYDPTVSGVQRLRANPEGCSVP